MRFVGLRAAQAPSDTDRPSTPDSVMAEDPELRALLALRAVVTEHGRSPALEEFLVKAPILSPETAALCGESDPDAIDRAIVFSLERLRFSNYLSLAVAYFGTIASFYAAVTNKNASYVAGFAPFFLAGGAAVATHRMLRVNVLSASDLLAVAKDLEPTATALAHFLPLTTKLPKTDTEYAHFEQTVKNLQRGSRLILDSHGRPGVPPRETGALISLGYTHDTFQRVIYAVSTSRPAVLDATKRLTAACDGLEKTVEALSRGRSANRAAQIQSRAAHLLLDTIRHGLVRLTEALHLVTTDLRTLKKWYTDKTPVEDETDKSAS